METGNRIQGKTGRDAEEIILVRPLAVTAPASITRQRIAFFTAGLLFSFVTFYVGFHWPDIFERVFQQPFNYAWQPTWYRIAGDVIDYLPVISVLLLIALRAFYGQKFRPVSYGAGVAVFLFRHLRAYRRRFCAQPFFDATNRSNQAMQR